jgi:divalent metal cation (Fe/Co/Zn/Cd) transporter
VTGDDDSGVTISSGERLRLERQASIAEWVTIAWNVLEMAVTIGLGVAARSLALVAFGFDSMIEVFASLVVVWHLRHPDRSADHVTGHALRLVAVAFLALAMSLALAAIWAIGVEHVPKESPFGIAYLTLTVFVMLGLALVKRRLGRRLGSRPLVAESRMSMLDGLLAGSVLIGLIVNAVWGWWWADAVAALVIAAAALAEGVENWREASELGDSAG